MPVKYKIQGIGQVEIPSSWNDVKFSTFVDLLNQLNSDPTDYIKILSIRTGISPEVLQANISVEDVLNFNNQTAFMLDTDSLKPFLIFDLNLPIRVGGLFGKKTIKLSSYKLPVSSWENYEKVKAALKDVVDQGKHHFAAADEIFFIYSGYHLNDMPVSASVGIAAFFLTRLTGLNRDIKDFVTTNPMKMKLKRELTDSMSSDISTPVSS